MDSARRVEISSTPLAQRWRSHRSVQRPSRPSDDPAGDFILKSQPKPEPRIILPTDALPKPDGPRKRIAAIATAYFRYSHADDIITKFIEGYAIAERTHRPHCEVVSLAIEQFPQSDIGRGMAARYGIPLFDSPTGAVTLGGCEARR